MSILVNEATNVIVQGITGREAITSTRGCLDYGTRIVGGVTPGKKGADVYGVPVYDCVRDITKEHKVDASVILVPARFIRDAAFEAITNNIPVVNIITEGIPRKDVAQILELGRQYETTIIGPNSVGIISPGKAKLGPIGGPAKDIKKAFMPGPVGVISRSGGFTGELSNLLTHNGVGQSTAISMGGDPLVGSTFVELLRLFEKDPQTRAVLIFGEPGGNLEAELASWVREHGTKLPIVVFIAGRFVEEIPGVSFGHAGSIVHGSSDTVSQKMALLRKVGITVAEEVSQIPALIKEKL
ncbi:succinate--CoA ligase subunit alpha [Chloroflexota bacterium]